VGQASSDYQPEDLKGEVCLLYDMKAPKFTSNKKFTSK